MKEDWKPGTLIYPLPAVLVSCGSTPEEYNILTVAWTGTLCTKPFVSGLRLCHFDNCLDQETLVVPPGLCLEVKLHPLL